VALALILLVSAGLLIRTFQALRNVQPGFRTPEQVLTLRISIPDAQVPDKDKVLRMENDILQKLAAIQGVTSVGMSNSVTMDGYTDNDPVFAEDHPTAEGKIPPLRRYKFIAPGYFKTMGNPLIAGRDIDWTDIFEKRSVVLISENFAREYWSSPAAALGRRVHENPKAPWRVIVGVTGDERDDGANQKAPKIIYLPLAVKEFWGEPVMVQRSIAYEIRSVRTGSANFLKEVQQAVWSVNPNLPIADVRTLQEILNWSMATTSFTLVMLGLAAGIALLLGIVGIYGVISYSVSQRTREIGIRVALGAPHGKVKEMFVREGFLLASVGLICGIAAAIALTRLMSGLLFEVSPHDPITYVLVSLILVTAAVMASYVPARRVTRIDPAEALRAE
jgi:predicted permease